MEERKTEGRGWVVAAALAALLSGAGLWQIGVAGRDALALGAAGLALFVSFLPYLGFGLTESARRLGALLRRGPGRLVLAVALLLVPYLLYGAGTGAFRLGGLATLALFAGVPTALVLAGGRSSRPAFWDAAAILAIWLPFDFRWLEAVWTWPEGLAAYGFNTLLAVDLALVLFVAYRGFEGVGYRFRLSLADLGRIAGYFAAFAAVAIPLGLAIDFIAVHPRPFDPFAFLGSFVAIFLFVALPEELLFRGLIQSRLERWLGPGLRSLVPAAVVFGAAHLNNAPAPNGKYFLLATIAGLAYGRVFTVSGGLTAPAAVHALVDAVWRAFFR